MPEVAVNLPFDSNEIKEIACAEFRKRLDQLGPLQGAKEYAHFELDYQVKIKLKRTGETTLPTETLAWGHVVKGDAALGNVVEEADVSGAKFESKDPNEERQERGMALTVETTDGRGGKTRRKVHVKG
jgi:hypothetical protein